MRRKSKLPQIHEDSSSSDTESNNDSDNSLEHQTASDVINSFLNSQTVNRSTTIPKSRRASDVINAFLQKNKIVDQANQSQFNSALDVINSFLRKDNFSETKTSHRPLVPSQRRRKDSSDDSTSDSESPANGNVAKKRRMENVGCEETESEIGNQLDRQVAATTIDGNSSVSMEENPLKNTTSPTIRRSLRAKPTNSNGNAKDGYTVVPYVKPKQNASDMLKVSFTREVVSKKMGTRRIVEQQNTEIPKDKYDRAVNILNATECRYDETPVDYNLPKTAFDVRRVCNGRRHAEVTHDTCKLGSSVPISLTRIVIELDNCLKRENWQQMAELVYFGCGLMKTEQSRRAIGTAFFTYALLLLILDSTPDSISTVDGKREEIMKFLIALGSEPDESEVFLKELNLVVDERNTTKIKSEVEL